MAPSTTSNSARTDMRPPVPTEPLPLPLSSAGTARSGWAVEDGTACAPPRTASATSPSCIGLTLNSLLLLVLTSSASGRRCLAHRRTLPRDAGPWLGRIHGRRLDSNGNWLLAGGDMLPGRWRVGTPRQRWSGRQGARADRP